MGCDAQVLAPGVLDLSILRRGGPVPVEHGSLEVMTLR